MPPSVDPLFGFPTARSQSAAIFRASSSDEKLFRVRRDSPGSRGPVTWKDSGASGRTRIRKAPITIVFMNVDVCHSRDAICQYRPTEFSWFRSKSESICDRSGFVNRCGLPMRERILCHFRPIPATQTRTRTASFLLPTGLHHSTDVGNTASQPARSRPSPTNYNQSLQLPRAIRLRPAAPRYGSASDRTPPSTSRGEP